MSRGQFETESTTFVVDPVRLPAGRDRPASSGCSNRTARASGCSGTSAIRGAHPLRRKSCTRTRVHDRIARTSHLASKRTLFNQCWQRNFVELAFEKEGKDCFLPAGCSPTF
jgi:hypothetical protein